ncbi:transcription termination factor NusA [bacterium]|nr:transcription termination factor NusA [bacterium]
MSNELIYQIEQISREKGINPDEIVHAIEDAILTTARKHYKNQENLIARLNRATGQVELLLQKLVVEVVGDPETEIEMEKALALNPEAKPGDRVNLLLSSRPLGRIDAQTAKQIIFQRVKEAERKKVYDEYSNRVGELLNGIVKNSEKGDLIVDLGTVEAILPKSQQSGVEQYSRGDRIRAVIVRVHRFSNDPQIVLSRTDIRLLTRVFESEIPEIYEGTITIKAAVREAGDRSKIAVATTHKEIDPVGACVGIKGTRVQSVINELHGERIDIIEWSDDIIKLASNALKPAKVAQVGMVDDKEKRLEIVVDNDQLSLAIGKKGQNVRLASKLTGWKIDIKSQDEKKKELAENNARLEAFRSKITQHPELGEKALQALESGGWNNLEKMKQIQAASEIPSLEPETAERLYQEIQDFVNSQVAAK